ncbi:ABC transporter permease [Arthrobacter cryoconiti]|uniref:ABC transporter permease n=1 Tax=Arthrobacter cryoconiti TaxID=748907 RepID=A0ABV8R1L1_9MICC|nr:ABC transporter permease [Arthrobacter cryoconiti]MCC9069812.1 ABC transporter permease [Arthrobacter cryoconiti]
MARRLLSTIPILLVVLTVVFLIIHLTPGSPAAVILGDNATDDQISNLNHQLGLDAPLYQQYFLWIADVFRGNLGASYFLGQSVTSAIISHIGPTFAIAMLAEIIAVTIAIPLGIYAASRRGTVSDVSIMGVSLLGMSIPSFLLGLFLALIFGVNLGWLPVAGYEPLSSGVWNWFQYLILASVALGSMQAALFVRMTRSSMLDVLRKDYIRTVRAKGVKERGVIYLHALRNASLPILTVVGQSVGGLITGAVVTETIFNIPGLGQLIVDSIQRRDLPVIQGTVLFITFAFIFVNLIVDVLYGVLDPRVRLK